MPAFYVPLAQRALILRTTVLVRTSGDPSRLTGATVTAVSSVDPDAPVTGVETLDQVVSMTAAQPRFNTTLLSTFASFGLVVALLGIYGLVAYSVGERLREFGVRRAVGASSLDLTRLILGEGVWAVGGGLAIGIGLAIAAGRWYQSQLFEISPTDPGTLTGVAVLIVAVAALAYGLPARRATQVDPVVVLRNE
jgi:ABC-type antimicrobial peptide transport system permease subunit